MKRLYAVVLLLLVSLALCACGDSNPTENPTSGVSTTPTQAPADATPSAAPIEASDEVIRSLTNQGNTARLKAFLEKTKAGEEVTIACLGGSITEGYKVSKSECYASLLKNFFTTEYGNNNVKLVNAGISGTPSNIGLMRLQNDVLSKAPDLVVVEFAVNDGQDILTQMMYDSLIRDCLTCESKPAVIILSTVTREGYSCEAQQLAVGKAYEVPVINVKSAIWPEITAGTMTYDDYSDDETHPNAAGHKRILGYFEYLFKVAAADTPGAEPNYTEVYAYLPDFCGMNLYEAGTLDPDALGGFKAAASGVGTFGEGWAWVKGSTDGSMVFSMTGKDLFVVYVNNNNAKYGTFEVYVDGELAQTVNTNDSSGWGGATFKTIINKSSAKQHTVEIKVPEDSLDKTIQLIGFATTGEIEGGHLIPDEELTYQERAIVSTGNTERLQKLFERAEAGEELTIGFIGGSITMGSGASNANKCYAKLVYDWFTKTFPKAKFTFVNAGIGATTSQFACARLNDDLLNYEPDFVVVEFSVNDEAGEGFRDSYESLVKMILESKTAPAVVTLNMVQYNDGYSVQSMHNEVAKAYKLPIVSMRNSIYKEILLGNLTASDVSADNLHPNDRGHAYTAEIVTYYLEQVMKKTESAAYAMPENSLTDLTWTKAVRYDNRNAEPVMNGFAADTATQNGITDVFKNGYKARNAGDSITFTVTGADIFVQYKKSNTLGAPKAVAIIDGDEANAVELDGNFENGWGNWLYLGQIYESDETAEHTVEIRITEAGTKQDLYLVSVIAK